MKVIASIVRESLVFPPTREGGSGSVSREFQLVRICWLSYPRFICAASFENSAVSLLVSEILDASPSHWMLD